MTRVLAAGLLTLAVSLTACAQEKKAAATIQLLAPASPTQVEVSVDGKRVEAAEKDGGTRVVTVPDLDPGKEYSFKVEAVIVPNNYTRIYRTRDVKVKAGGTATVDVRTEDKAIKDRIVVRWVPTPDDIVDEMCKLAKVTKSDVVHDYGCGDAVMLIRAVKNFGAKKGFGNDIDPKMVAKANEKIEQAGLKDKVTVVQGDILKMTEKDCGEATVVLLYLGDDLGTKISPVLQKALKPGARVVSHRFHLGDWKPTKSVTVNGVDGGEYHLHLWIVPEKK